MSFWNRKWEPWEQFKIDYSTAGFNKDYNMMFYYPVYIIHEKRLHKEAGVYEYRIRFSK